MALPACLPVFSLRACVSSVPADDSLLLVLFPGPLTLFMVLFCGLAAAIDRIFRLIIADAECNTVWNFSQARYKRFPYFLNGKSVSHDATNLFPNASSRIWSRTVFPIDCLRSILSITYSYSILLNVACISSIVPYLRKWYHSSSANTRVMSLLGQRLKLGWHGESPPYWQATVEILHLIMQQIKQ